MVAKLLALVLVGRLAGGLVGRSKPVLVVGAPWLENVVVWVPVEVVYMEKEWCDDVILEANVVVVVVWYRSRHVRNHGRHMRLRLWDWKCRCCCRWWLMCQVWVWLRVLHWDCVRSSSSPGQLQKWRPRSAPGSE